MEDVNAEHNQLTIRTQAGMTHTYCPTKLRGVEVYREEEKQLMEGERIQFRAPQGAEDTQWDAWENYHAVDPERGQVTITLDRGSSFSTTLKELRHIEYGYATTSYSSQGSTIDRVLVNIDTEQSVALVNQQQFYVSISRARQDARIFTNKRDELSQVVSRSWPKATALEAVAISVDDPHYTQQRDRARNRTVVRQQAQHHHEWRRTPPVTPVFLLPNQRTPSLVHGQHQRDVALLVSYRQKDWWRERRQPVPEQTVARSPAALRQELLAPTPRREETPEQKPARSRGIRYSR